MRKIASIVLLSCLLVYVGGYHLVFAVHQYGLKKEMRAYLKTHPDIRYGSYFSLALTNGTVTNTAFEWEEENEEFRYNNELYDVVSVHQNNDTLYVSALKDDSENNLEQQVNEVRHSQQSSSGSAVHTVKLWPVIYLQANKHEVATIRYSVIYPCFHLNSYPSTITEVHTPPPRC